jgi:DNA adenine methylase
MGRVIYADPPYDDTFSSYTSAGFNKSRQAALAAVLGTLVTQQGASVIATNADTPFIRGLYEAQGFQIATLQAPRRIAANPEKRTDATELLMVRNVPKEAWDEICHSIGSPKSCSPSALTSMA